MKRVAVSVSNDLVTDQRVQRSIAVLQDHGYEVSFIGRQLPASKSFEVDYHAHRFKLNFHKGFLFYAQLNLWLFFYLLFRKPYDLYWSNDLDTLLPNFLIAKLYGKPLIYDSHEYFCGVPEIQNRPLVKKVWQSLEAWIFPKLKHVITVNDSIARLYEEDYGFRPLVLRNIGSADLPLNPRSRKELGLPQDAYIVINQGSGINVDRGMEEFIQALGQMDSSIHLLVVGKGDVVPFLKNQVRDMGIVERVHFVGPKPYLELLEYTMQADLGISLDKDTNINYRYSLPNKLFDYIKCGIPILCSKVMEVRSIVEENNLGLSTSHDSSDINAKLEEIRAKGKLHYKTALEQAAAKYNWIEERKVIDRLIAQIEEEQSMQSK